jgi:hypothetical protein
VGSWGQGQSAPREVREGEAGLEAAVSRYVGAMPFLWIEIDDVPSKTSARNDLERNAIGLLSNAKGGMAIDPPSADWLGYACPQTDMRRSVLWNSKHIEHDYDPAFLDRLDG